MRFTGRLGILIWILLSAVVATYAEANTASITTNDPTDVTANSAGLHATLNPGGATAAGWFEWGKTTSLGQRTDPQIFSDGTATSVALSASIRNLDPHTTYYFRAVLYHAVVGGGTINGDVKSFTTAGDASPTTTISVNTGDATGVTSSAATLNGTVNPGGGSVSAWFDWGTTTSFGNRTDVHTIPAGTTPVPVTFSLKNLQAHTTYYFRLDAYRSGGAAAVGDVKTFTTSDAPAPAPLTMATLDATAITSTSATLNGKVTAGGTFFGAWFEYGTTTSLGTRTDVQTFSESTTNVALTQTLGHLLPNTTYYFRAVAYRSGGTMPGDVKTFTTSDAPAPSPLTVTTGDATGITSASATLSGKITAGSTPFGAWFEYGTTSGLGTRTDVQTFSNDATNINMTQTLGHLLPNTTYYFRVVGYRSGGTVSGDVKTFTTTRVPSTAPEKISEVETGQIKSGYLIITPDTASSAPTVTFTYGTISQGSVQSQAGIIPTMMATDASMFVEVIPSISRNIGVAIANPGNSVNAVTLTLRDESGIVLGSPANISVSAHQQVAKFVSELFGDVIANGFRGSLRMQSATPFAVAGLRFSGAIFSTLPVAVTASVAGVPSIALAAGAAANSPAAGNAGGPTAVIVPQFAIAGGWATQIALVNNTNATVVGRIDVFDANGTPMAVKLNGETRSTFTYSIPVGGTFVLAPRDQNGQSPL